MNVKNPSTFNMLSKSNDLNNSINLKTQKENNVNNNTKNVNKNKFFPSFSSKIHNYYFKSKHAEMYIIKQKNYDLNVSELSKYSNSNTNNNNSNPNLNANSKKLPKIEIVQSQSPKMETQQTTRFLMHIFFFLLLY